ncbi:hypothetical protein [Bradyrhizobium sp. CCGB01]|uniref:hypothetical protein n=1 Tax=Bradyrhizobium sp. CCGB01 TaxID=2949634 RepID=UPI0020B25626|nr:hypothetical protein [Bradyrhizobium sp. CCGB01]MCP3406903.1 hypothetical protein [Bradyrhizobium sp. CCGB01]
MALARGGDALGGASETGGATEVWPLALSCDEAPTNMRPRANSVTLLIRILQTLWFIDCQHRAPSHAALKTIRTHMAVKAP